jgi:general secretion pathway protein I
MSRAPNDQGFSLVESLVALGVFAMAGVALVQLQAHSLSTFARIEQRALADIVAQNRLTEIAASNAAPPLGLTQEEVAFGGRAWRLGVTVARTPDSQTRRVSVAVGADDAEQIAVVHAFVRVPEGAP